MIHIPLQLHPDDRARYLEIRDAKAAVEDSRPRPEVEIPFVRVRLERTQRTRQAKGPGALAIGGGDAV